MGKKEGSLISNISDEVVEKLIAVAEDKADNFLKEYERNNIRKCELEEKKLVIEKELKEKKSQLKQNFCKNEQDLIRMEFNRIIGIMQKTDPLTNEYRNLTDSLYNMKKLLTGWGGSDYDW